MAPLRYDSVEALLFLLPVALHLITEKRILNCIWTKMAEDRTLVC